MFGAQKWVEPKDAAAECRHTARNLAAGLAHPDASQLVEIIRRIHGRGIAIVLIEHHMDVVTALCNTVTVLDGGQVIAEGTADEVKRNPKVVEAYLGAAA